MPDNFVQNRIDDIQVLRGIAILWVLIWHLHSMPWVGPIIPQSVVHWVRPGVGVDLFFVISGYVIGRSLLPTLYFASGGREKIRTVLLFWLRRAFRLFPSAWFWMAVIVCASAIFQNLPLWRSVEANLWSALSVVLHFANYRLATNWGEMGAGAIYWSLSLEEQFYFVLPIAVLFFRKKIPLAAALSAIIALQFLVERNFLQILFRSEGLAFGVLLAIAQTSAFYQFLEPRIMRFRSVRWFALSLLMALMLGASSPAFMELFGTSASRGSNLVACFGMAIVFLASFDRSYVMAEGRLQRVFKWIGARSYALYLCHFPSIYLTIEIVTRLGIYDASLGVGRLTTLIISIALMTVFAHLNYRYLETPLNAYGKVLASRWSSSKATPSS
ncbi:MAG: acyltransferase [Pseudomonadota bacterium]